LKTFRDTVYRAVTKTACWLAGKKHEQVAGAMDHHSPALFTRGEISHIRIWSAGVGKQQRLQFSIVSFT
jgi:hypothetical protein